MVRRFFHHLLSGPLSDSSSPFISSPKPLHNPITIHEVQKAVARLSNHKSPGPDQIPIEAIKYGTPTLHAAICRLYNDILSTNTFPNNFLAVSICPINKPGKPSTVDNVRQ